MPTKRIAEAVKIQLKITADGLQGLEQFTFDPEDENLQGLVALAELFDKRAAAVASDKNLSAAGRKNGLLAVARDPRDDPDYALRGTHRGAGITAGTSATQSTEATAMAPRDGRVKTDGSGGQGAGCAAGVRSLTNTASRGCRTHR